MNGKQTIEKYLVDNGYDGLCEQDYECSCEVGDLIPCGGSPDSCIPGHKIYGCSDDCGIGCDWHIKPGKRE